MRTIAARDSPSEPPRHQPPRPARLPLPPRHRPLARRSPCIAGRGGGRGWAAYLRAAWESGELLCWRNGPGDEREVLPGSYRAVGAGRNHTCAVRQSGEVECWGIGYGQYGEMDAPSGSYRSVTAGEWHTCAVRESGEVDCWGSNEYGQTDAPAGRFRSVSAGLTHTCGLRESGQVACWGNNEHGQVDAPAGVHQSVSAGGFHTCALGESGEVDCWGRGNPYGLGRPWGRSARWTRAGATPARSAIRESCGAGGITNTARVRPCRGSTVFVSAGYTHTCALRVSGEVDCWGWNYGPVGVVAGELPFGERGKAAHLRGA